MASRHKKHGLEGSSKGIYKASLKGSLKVPSKGSIFGVEGFWMFRAGFRAFGFFWGFWAVGGFQGFRGS